MTIVKIRPQIFTHLREQETLILQALEACEEGLVYNHEAEHDEFLLVLGGDPVDRRAALAHLLHLRFIISENLSGLVRYKLTDKGIEMLFLLRCIEEMIRESA